MIVERALADADFGGDGVDAHGANAAQIEQPVGGFEDPLLHRQAFRVGTSLHRPVYFRLDDSADHPAVTTDRCNQARCDGRSRVSSRPIQRRTRTMRLLQTAPPHASDPDRRLGDAQPEHGPAPEPRHLPAAADARHRHLGVRLHAGHRGAEPGLGIPAAARRRADGALRLRADHDGRRAALRRWAWCCWRARRAARRHARRGRADRHVAGLHRQRDGDVGRRRARCLRRVRSTVLGIVSAAGSLGAMLSAPIGQLLNEGYGWRTGLWGFVVLSLAHAAGGLVRGQGGQIPLPPRAADDIADTSAAVGGEDRARQRVVRGDDLRLFRLRHAARLPHHAPAVVPAICAAWIRCSARRRSA